MFNNLKGRIQLQILSEIYNWLLNLFLLSFSAHICLQTQLNEGFLFYMRMIVTITYLFWALDWLWGEPIFLSLQILGNYCKHIFTFLLRDKKPTVVVKKVFFAPISGFSTWNSCVLCDVGHPIGGADL